MSNPDIPESPQVKLMYEWGQAFVKMDVDLIAKCLHKDYRHIRYPESLGLSEETREEYLKHMAEIISLWTDNDASPQFLQEFTHSPLIPSPVYRPFDHRRLREGRRSRPYSKLVKINNGIDLMATPLIGNQQD